MVERVENWPIKFSKYLKERKNMPFEWGKNDCLTFVSGAVGAIIGYDFYQEEYLPYFDEKTAADMLAQYGGVRGIISEHLGNEGSTNVLCAGRGDVVILDMPEEMAGIVDDTGRYICVILAEGGMRRVPLKSAKRYWSY